MVSGMIIPFFFYSSLISQLQKLQSLRASKVPRAVTARSTQTSTCLMVRFLACRIIYGQCKMQTEGKMQTMDYKCS